jgi:hypothetical protein
MISRLAWALSKCCTNNFRQRGDGNAVTEISKTIHDSVNNVGAPNKSIHLNFAFNSFKVYGK